MDESLYNKKSLKETRRQLRNNLTPAEARLWKSLQNKQLDGRKFRRQYSVGNYVLDFYCPVERLAIELDGQGHFSEAGMQLDLERDDYLKSLDIKVLRFENHLVITNIESVLEEIKQHFKKESGLE